MFPGTNIKNAEKCTVCCLKIFLSFTSDAIPCLVLQLFSVFNEKIQTQWSGVHNIFLCCKAFFIFPCFEQITAIKLVLHISEYCLKLGWNLDSFKFISGILQYVYNCWAWRKLMSIFIALFLLMFKHCVCNSINKETAWLVQSNASLKLHFYRNFNPQCLALASVPHGEAKTKS